MMTTGSFEEFVRLSGSCIGALLFAHPECPGGICNQDRVDFFVRDAPSSHPWDDVPDDVVVSMTAVPSQAMLRANIVRYQESIG
jgi:hypothetical protein